MVSDLNPALRRRSCSRSATRRSASCFGRCDRGFLFGLLPGITLEVFPQREWLQHKGSIGKELFVIVNGAVNVFIDEQRMLVVRTLGAGEYFGEEAVFEDCRRSASAQAKEAVEAMIVAGHQLRKMLALYPSVADEIREVNARRQREEYLASGLVDNFNMRATGGKGLKDALRRTLTCSAQMITDALAASGSSAGSGRRGGRRRQRLADAAVVGCASRVALMTRPSGRQPPPPLALSHDASEKRARRASDDRGAGGGGRRRRGRRHASLVVGSGPGTSHSRTDGARGWVAVGGTDNGDAWGEEDEAPGRVLRFSE